MIKVPTAEERINAARIREEIDHSLRNYYQACMAHELPPQLRAVLKKLDEEKPEPGHAQTIGKTND